MIMTSHPRYDAKNYIGMQTNINILEYTINRDIETHWHNFWEIELILDGCGSQNLNGQKYELKRGNIYMLSPTDFHQLSHRTPIHIISIKFNESSLTEQMLQTLLSISRNMVVYLNENELIKIIKLLDIINEECTHNRQYKAECLRNIMEYFLLQLIRYFNLNISEKLNSSTDHIKKAILYLNMHFRESPSLKKIANVVNLHPNYFSNLFHKTTGQSYIQYIITLKINYAKMLLWTSDFTIIDICNACGFNSISNFAKAFKESTGMSPSSYRNSKNKSNIK